MAAENRLGLNYRDVPRRKGPGPIVDAHAHVNDAGSARAFFEAAHAYGVTHVVSMTPLEHVERVREAFGGRISFIAIPRWKEMSASDEFLSGWLADLTRFRELGARVCKFWMAPPMRERHGWTLDHERLRPVVDHAAALGLRFMVHVGDPSVWWRPGGKYADAATFGSKADQYPQLEWLLDYVAPRIVIAAHMGGSIEEPERLHRLLEAHPNLMLDTSATKWIVRETARDPEPVRRLLLRHPERILFGSDLVTSSKTDRFDHYASRYWAHLHLWETGYRGESPIEDPDAEGPPRLVGIDLPVDVLEKLYHLNAVRAGVAPAPEAA